MISNTLTQGKLPSLNGLRAISVLMVMLHHTFIMYPPLRAVLDVPVLGEIVNFFTQGQMGVNVFFVISGFLITTLLTRELAANGRVSIKNFYIRRAFRIFPAYYFILLVYFLLQVFGYWKFSNDSWFTSLTYLKYTNWNADWESAHFWSLSIEENFYLFWPFLFIGGQKFRKISAVLLVLLAPIIRIYAYYTGATWFDNMSIFNRIDAIALGCLVSMYAPQIIEKLQRNFKLWFVLAVLLLFCLIRCEDMEAGFLKLYLVVPFGAANGTFANLAIAIIMLYSVFGKHGIWFKFLNLKVMTFIGALSYSLYLWQQVFINIFLDTWMCKPPYNFFMIVVCALFSYYVVEKPFLRWKDKFTLRSAKKKLQ